MAKDVVIRMQWYGPRVTGNVFGALEDAMKESVELLETDIKQSFPSEGGGIKWPNLPHRSSSWGQIPTKQSGELHDSIVHELQEKDGRKLVGLVGTEKGTAGDEYGIKLELGQGKLKKPRPFMRRGLGRNTKKIMSVFADKVAIAIAKGK